MGHVRKKETNNIDTSRRINLFSNAEDSNYLVCSTQVSVVYLSSGSSAVVYSNGELLYWIPCHLRR